MLHYKRYHTINISNRNYDVHLLYFRVKIYISSSTHHLVLHHYKGDLELFKASFYQSLWEPCFIKHYCRIVLVNSYNMASKTAFLCLSPLSGHLRYWHNSVALAWFSLILQNIHVSCTFFTLYCTKKSL